ncbi:MAG TPA: HyaD/HybD family hydrogenase maturation endopeptidase [Vicinamibacterales bacterium]|nr:HyaD/HybD family hydrogenase maturation endopeptidase [Vicinamibacterales bacterium]
MIYVLGLGNVLMGDDGFGPAVVRQFEKTYDVPENVEVVDVGTPGLDLMPWFYDAERLIIVDTVKADAAPGTMRLYDKRDLLRHAPSVRTSPHDPGVKEALWTLELAGRGPKEVTLIGVVPESVELTTDLSDTVREKIPVAMEAIARALGQA